MKMGSILFLILSLSSIPVQAGWFGPSNYDECIIESMKGVQSNIAARLIYKSCKKKFPTTRNSQPATKLPDKFISMLDGKASIKTGRINGNIYNGTRVWKITSIVLSLRHNDTKLTALLSEEYYKININVSPLSSSDFKIDTNWTRGETDSWDIKEAYGYKIKE